MVEKSWFEPQQYFNGTIDGVTADLLADLYDIVAKFGSENPGTETSHLHLFKPSEVYVSAVTREGNMNMIVSSIQGGIEVSCAVGILLSDPLPSAVVWDKRVGTEDVREFIARIDGFMRKKEGAFDPGTGERLRKPFVDRQSAKMRVDDFFLMRGKILTATGGLSAAETRENFDRPEELTIMVSADGTEVLCRREDEEYISRRTEIILEIAAERYGARDSDAIARIPKRELEMILLEAIDRLDKEYD